MVLVFRISQVLYKCYASFTPTSTRTRYFIVPCFQLHVYETMWSGEGHCKWWLPRRYLYNTLSLWLQVSLIWVPYNSSGSLWQPQEGRVPFTCKLSLMDETRSRLTLFARLQSIYRHQCFQIFCGWRSFSLLVTDVPNELKMFTNTPSLTI